MKQSILLLLILLFKISIAQNIIPMPNKINLNGKKFSTENIHWVLQCNKENWIATSTTSFEKINNIKNIKHIGIEKNIPININITDDEKENYKLQINENEITIKGNDAGCFDALNTLEQLLQNDNTIQCGIIEDAPRFAYRGMHLDVCRHFFTVEGVKKYIQLLARYHFNNFHWHLTDDQGWRIEIKKYPLLTTIGSTRKQTLIGKQKDEKGTGEYDNKIESGFYTQEQIKEIVQFATDRKINIIPEIEMPGHSLAAIASYPFLGCRKIKVDVGQRWGVFDDVYCAGNDSTYQFMHDVLDEVMQLFPSKYIHIGGDEVVKTNWKKCILCQAKMKANNLKNENELQSYFIKNIDNYLTSKNRILIGWDEILKGGLAANATVMSWRGEDGGIEAAKQNHKVIMTPGGYCYFDHNQNKTQQEPLCIGGNTSYEKVYNYNPIPKKLAPENEKYILGAQANLWTEYIADWDKLCYLLMPRMQALSEALWTKPENKNFQNFQKRLGVDLIYLDSKKYNYRMPEPIGWQDTITNTNGTLINWKALNKNYNIQYYFDKDLPIYYKKPFAIASNKKNKYLYCIVSNKIKQKEFRCFVK